MHVKEKNKATQYVTPSVHLLETVCGYMNILAAI